MQRLFPYLLILSCLSLYHNLLSFNAAVSAQCDTATQSLQCANLRNLSFPFAGAGDCAASESFVVNCSSVQAYWEAFINALGGNEEKPPALTGIYQTGYSSLINLTWNLEFSKKEKQACHALSADEVSDYIPPVINLTSFANGSFQLSQFNHILLLNCSNLTSSTPPRNVKINNTICLAYQEQCSVFKSAPCAEIVVPTQELTLQRTLETFSCTNFQLLVATWNTTSSIPIPSWKQGLLQLFYEDKNCEACLKTGGICIPKPNSATFDKCNCGDAGYSKTTCPRPSSCKGFHCSSTRIAVAVSSAVVALVIATLLVLCIFYRKRGYSTRSFTSSTSNRLLTQRAYLLSKKFGPVETKEFSFNALSKATESFAEENIIGDGGFGAVYLGILNGRKVAIKRLYHDNFRRMDHFYNEIKILSNLSHPNLVKLYGFCCQDSTDLLLVFEYASNGTVFDQLHDDTKPAMPWRTRLNMAMETAEALSYLHNSVKPPIYHRDVKTTNILLDDNLHAKLADFGLSRLVPLQATHVSTAPQGTPGYLDPDYHQCYQLTDKSDVYSFGVVLVELVSAKLAVDMSRDRREINLSNLALMKIGCGQWEELVDPRLEMRKNPDVELMVKRVIELAFMCLHAEKDSRPTMKYVADTLASMCKQCDYRHDDDDANVAFSFKVDISAPSSADETSKLIKSKSTSKSTLSADSPPLSGDWTSSNTSSYVNSF